MYKMSFALGGAENGEHSPHSGQRRPWTFLSGVVVIAITYGWGTGYCGAVINIIGDPVAIFVLDLGIRGAA